MAGIVWRSVAGIFTLARCYMTCIKLFEAAGAWALPRRSRSRYRCSPLRFRPRSSRRFCRRVAAAAHSGATHDAVSMRATTAVSAPVPALPLRTLVLLPPQTLPPAPPPLPPPA